MSNDYLRSPVIGILVFVVGIFSCFSIPIIFYNYQELKLERSQLEVADHLGNRTLDILEKWVSDEQ